MELKVWVEGIQRVVCGLNDASTCQDVVLVLAHAIGRTGRFTLVERWRDTERLISPTENPLHVLQKWGEYAHDVKFILRWSDGGDETPAKGHALEPNHGTASGSKRTEGFLHNFSPHKTPEKPQNNVEQKNASSIKKSYTFSGARRPFSGDSRKTASGRAGHDLISENASSLDSYDEDLSPPSSNSSPYSSIRSTNGSQQQNGDDHNHFLNHHHHMDNRYHQHNNHYHQSQQQHNNHSRSSSNASASTGPSVTGSGSSVHSPHSSITDRHHHRSPARPPAYNKPSFVNGTTVISSQDTLPMSKLTIADSAYTSASSASSPARSSGSSNGSGRGMSRGGAGNGAPGSVGMTPQRTRGAPPPYKPPPPSYKSNGFYSSRNKPADTRQVAAEEYKLEDNLVSSDRTHQHTPTANRHKTDYGDRLTNRVEGYSDSPSHKQDYSSTTNHRRELSDSANHRWERDESANRSAHHRREEAVGDDSSAIEERQELMRLVQLQREKLSKQNTTISELEAKLQADCSIEVTEDNLLDDEISRLTSQINELTVRSDGYEKELQELQLSSWEDKLRIEKQQESMLHSEIKLLQSQIATAKSDLEQQISQQTHLTEELETLNKERNKSRNSEQLAQRQTSEKQDQLEKVNKELTSKRQSLEEIEKEMMDLEEQLATRELQITQLERNVRQDNLQVFCADNNLSLLNSSDEPSPSPGRSPAHRPSSARKMTYSPQMMKNTYNPGGYLV